MALFSTPASGQLWARTRAARRITVALGVIALTPSALADAAAIPPVPHVRVAPGPATQKTPSVPGHPLAPVSATGSAGHPAKESASDSYKVPATTWPTGAATVSLSPAHKARSASTAVALGTASKAGSLPVTLAGADVSSSAAKSASVTFASHAAAQAAGIDGVVFTLARTDGASSASPTQVSLNYSSFAAAYGGAYADRLKLVQLPACALTTPKLSKCRTQTPVHFTNDLKSSTLTATVPIGGMTAKTQSSAVASAGGAVVFASVPSTSSSVGTYSATSLSPAGTWSAGGSSGAFTYSYPITVPPSVGGATPSVALSYDSSSVDGRTSDTNAQASWIGDGWDYSPGFIERSYQPCSQDGISNSSDVCWGGNILTISWAGRSGALVRDDANPNTWHLQGDDGTQVIPLSGANNGAWQGEAWELVTSDGTRYYFGENHLPGGNGSDPATGSAWTEPVYCPKSGDGPTYLSGAPSCNTSAGSGSFAANMAWRWNLDYVVDPHGNLQTYTWAPETNIYARGANGTPGNGTNTTYTRGGYLSTIKYGYRLSDAIAGTAPLDTVTFNVAERCDSNYPNTCTSSYSDLTSNLSNSAVTSQWPDVPSDQICTGSSGTCSNVSATFFSTYALASIVTSVRTGSTQNTVDTYTLQQMFPSPEAGVISSPVTANQGDGTAAVLWLSGIQHTGNDTLGGGTAASTPEITFVPEMMADRVDGATSGAAALYRPRMDSITTESGSQIVVSYDITSPQNCTHTNNNMPASPDTDAMFCFAQYWTQTDGNTPIQDWFNIYPVQEVTVNDQPDLAHDAWSEAQITQYSYAGAAWHRDDSPLTPDAQRTWNQFRGFRTVTTTSGISGAQDTPTQTVTTYMQGMDGDYKSDGTQRSVTISDSVGDTVTDSAWLQGQVLETDTLSGVGGAPQTKSVNGPWTYTSTASEAQADSMPALVARMSKTSEARSYSLWHDGTWKHTETDTTYDSSGRVVTSDAKGDGTSAVPEVCTTTSYATSTSSSPNMIDYPDEEKAVQGPCGTAATASNTVSDGLTFYDGSTTLGALTGVGDATETQAVDSYDATGAPKYIPESTTTYDAYGRTLTSTDAGGHKTTTVYSAPGSSPDTVTVTNPAGWGTTTTLDPARAVAIASTDVNGELTTKTYDGLGRVTAVWSPLHSQASKAPADDLYSYNVSNTSPSTVSTQTLRSDGTYGTTIQFYDGSLRAIQTQAMTADGSVGRLITDTHYNSLGQTVKTTSPYVDATTEPDTTAYVGTDSKIPQETETLYDGMGRAVQTLMVADGLNQWSATTAYKGADETDVTPPKGGTATSTFVDAIGRTIASWAYTTPTPTDNAANATVTSYTYNAAGKIAGMTDTVGDAWSWNYDLHGNQVKAVDPETGTTTNTYNPTGTLASTTDARGTTLSYSYDVLGRETTEYNTTGNAQPSAANEQALWNYDTLANGTSVKGQLASTSRYTNGATDATHTYTESVAGYTALYQSTGESVTIPSSEGNLAGTYHDVAAYQGDTSVPWYSHYYSEGGLPAEIVSYSIAPAGVMTAFGGTNDYLNQASYTALGQVLQTNFGAYGEQFDQTETYDLPTGRLLTQTASVQSSPTSNVTAPIDDAGYTYNQAGSATSISNQQTGDATPDTQCFNYDNQQRLTAAYTDTAGVATTTNSQTAQVFGIGGCNDTAATAGKITGGPAPYAQTYSYDALGDRVAETQQNTTTAAPSTTQALAYSSYNPSTGATSAAANPDAVQTVTTTTPTGSSTATYGYTDGNGDTNSRTVTTTGSITASPSQAVTYDAEDHTQTVTNKATGTASSYLYDADGNLLVQKDQASNQNTLYLPWGEEIYLNTGNGAVSGNRYISASPDGVTIVHSSSGAITYETGDPQHTATVAVSAANLAVTNRYYDPYGNPRGTTPGTWPDPHAFLGQPQDQTTGLDLLGARQYDPTTGRFLSVDPILETGDQRQMNGYAYSADDPVNNSDPTGAVPESTTGCVGTPQACAGENSTGGVRGGPCTTCKKPGPDTGSSGTSQGNTPSQTVTLVASVTNASGTMPLIYAPANVSWLNQFEANYKAVTCEGYQNWCQDTIPSSMFKDAVQACNEIPACANSGYFEYLKNQAYGLPGLTTIAAVVAGALPELANAGSKNGFGSSGNTSDADEEAEAVEAQAEDEIDEAMCEGGQSFTADTLVLTASGQLIPISDLHAGEQIIAVDTATGKNHVETIDAVLVHHDTNLYDLEINTSSGKQVIHTTANHMIWDLTTHQWVEAAKLHKGDHLLTSNGTIATADGETVPSDQQGWMWDLTVDTLHTFYVVAGDTPVLVHNAGGAANCLIGQQGEAASGITKNTQTIIINGRARIPDEFDPAAGIIGEVKNVKYQYLSTQLKDDLSYAQANGWQFNLYVNSTTRLSGPLQSLVDSGQINLIRNIP